VRIGLWERTRNILLACAAPFGPLGRLVGSPRKWGRYLRSRMRYGSLPGAEPLRWEDNLPCLFDATPTTPFDPHYFYQSVWATERIARSGARAHVDVGSDARFVGPLTVLVPVIFVDLRPLRADLPRLSDVAADLRTLPFRDSSIRSLSCLHVAEHVGLGRYGDRLNPAGTREACAELARVLAPDGNLFFSLPLGRPRVCFNAHRIHSPAQILGYFPGLRLAEFSAVDDRGRFRASIRPQELEAPEYACGLFWLRRDKGTS